MNIELLLRQYLYQHKTIAYPGIGRIVLGADVQLPESIEKGETLPLQDIHFTFNLQEAIDKDFIAFVSMQTGKIEPLASADIESYFMLNKQFINIGKSFTVEGIGSVDKQDNGTYIFIPGYFLPISEMSAAPHKPLKIRETQLPTQKVDMQQIRATSPFIKKMLWALVVLISVVLIIRFIYYSFFSGLKTDKINSPVVDTVKTNMQKSGSLPARATGFKAIIEERHTRKAAEGRVKRLRVLGHDAQVDSIYPTTFRIYIPVKDSTVSVDSLQLFIITGKRPKFEPMQ